MLHERSQHRNSASPVRAFDPRTISLALLACALAIRPASGQTLNLDAPSAPAPGAGKATLDLAAQLDLQIEQIQKNNAGAVGDPQQAHVSDPVSLQIALRTLARNLLRAGEQAGEPGSHQVIAGRTLALRIAGLDALVGAPRNNLPPSIAGQIRTLCTTAPEKLPTDPQTLARFLRDALAPLVTMLDASTPGLSVSVPAEPLLPRQPTLAPTARTAKVSPEIIASCEQLDQRLESASRWPAYRRTRDTLLANAADALWLLDAGTSTSVMPATRQAIAEQFITAAAELNTPMPAGTLPSMDDASAIGSRRMRTLALLARCIRQTSLADPQTSARSLRDALTQLPLIRDPRTNQPRDLLTDPLLPDRLMRLSRLLESLQPPAGASAFMTVDDLPRQLRPALKPLEESRRQAGAELLEMLARAVTSPDIISDPGFLQGISSYRRRREELMMLREVTSQIAHKPNLPTGAPGTQWVLQDHYEPLGDRLMLLARGIASPRDHDDALAQWRIFAADILLLTRQREEDQLRLALSAEGSVLTPHAAAITADRTMDLLGRLDAAKSAWLIEVRKARQIQSEPLRIASRQLQAARIAIAITYEWARLRSALFNPTPGAPAADAGSALDAWELSAEAAWNLASADLPAITAGLALAADGKADEFLASGWERPSMPVRSLLRRVNSLAADRGLHALNDDAADALRQIALGPEDPDRGSAGALEPQLAVMSRYLEELAAAIARSDADATARLLRFLETRIDAANSTLDEQGPG
ncbi:MAG: hypothetical protein IT435_13095 [Phycisphaerales bacterium]|nr:hypothetical protein [Phycisphaerales bacterium]